MSTINDLKVKGNVEKINLADSNHHKVVKASGSTESKKNDNSSDRIEVDLTSVSKPEEPDPNIHESPIKDILEGENSPFQKYIDNKTAEMVERMALEEQSRSLDSEDDESDIERDIDLLDPVIIDMAGDSSNTYDEESDEEEKEEIVVEDVDISSIEEEINTDEIDNSEDIEETSSSDNENESKEENKKEEEDIPVPDIDLDVESVESKNDIPMLEEEEEQKEDNDEILEHLRKIATEKLKPAAKSLDISSFTVIKKPTANIKSLEFAKVKAAKWVLPNQETTVQMKEFSGSEIEDLREASEDVNSLTQLYRKFKIIYDHIVSPKPATCEAWLKSVPYSDVEHYFFCAYISSFKGSNYIPMDCTNKKCEKTYLTDDVPIMDMVKFANKEASDKFTKLYKSEKVSSAKGLYVSEIVPLSNNVAIGFKEPTIYSAFEIASLSDSDKNKFSSIIEYVPYIDALYIIDKENSTLEPIGYKVFPDNATKTVKSKIKVFDAVLKTLSVDEFAIIRSFIRQITDKIDGITYQYPSVECPYCKTASEAVPVLPSQALFTRAQIGALVNTTLK